MNIGQAPNAGVGRKLCPEGRIPPNYSLPKWIDGGHYTISKPTYRRVAKVGKRIIWATVVDKVVCPPYLVGFVRDRMKMFLEEFVSLPRAKVWAKENP